MAKYDVFLSCKSEDYRHAEEVYDFLNENGINVFLASRELRKVGESEYRRAISRAMKDACHLIVFASNAEYIDSPWVYYEWDMFVNAKLKGFKPGNIITILEGVPTEEINMDLWKYESMPFESYKDTLLQYVETEDSKRRLEELREIERKEQLRKQREEEERKRIQQLKEKLAAVAENYKKALSALSADANMMHNLLRSIGIASRECPVCGRQNDLDQKSCEECGWPLSPTDGIPGLEYLYSEKEKPTRLFKENFNKLRSCNDTVSSMQSLKDENEGLKSENLSLKESIANGEATRNRLNRQLEEMTSRVADLEDELNQRSKIYERSSHAAKNSCSQMDNAMSDFGSNNRESLRYSLWVTYCTPKSESIIRHYNNSYAEGLRWERVNGSKCGVFVKSYDNKNEAIALKNLLELAGATVVIKDNHEVEASAPIKYGIRVKMKRELVRDIGSWWKIASELALLLSLQFGESSGEYRKQLGNGVIETPKTLTRYEADQLCGKINQLGAIANVVQ